jgi:sodium/potassium-transporting ATPase subunit alpha
MLFDLIKIIIMIQIIGRIASLTTDQSERKSTLQRELDHFVTVISAFAILMGLVIFGIGCLVNGFSDVLDTFINGFLIVIIACVPQGLPATVTTQLTIIARRMAKKHVFLKKLDVIESLGACTVIASDKTGTLTKNSMTVTDIWYDKHYMSGKSIIL